MTFSVRYSALLGMLLIVTLSLKLIGDLNQDRYDHTGATGQLTELFAVNDLTVMSIQDSDNLHILQGISDDCRLFAFATTPTGEHMYIPGTLAGPEDHIFYYYDGVAHDRHPRLWTIFDYHVGRLFAPLGINRPAPPVIAVVTSPQCLERASLWTGFQVLSAHGG